MPFGPTFRRLQGSIATFKKLTNTKTTTPPTYTPPTKMSEPQQANGSLREAEGREVEAFMSVAGGPGGLVHAPIHESITLAALINGNFGVARGTTLQNVSTQDWEYVRGAVWNDDPACLLFDDSEGNNRTYSLGAEWLFLYEKGATEWRDRDESRDRNPTGRSHYGDLQFLHSMACKPGEAANETKRKVMVWLEVMYKLATGEDGINSGTIVKDTKLKEFTPPVSLPPRSKPMQYLLSKDTKFRGVDIGRRAIGSMFHIIQDSYAIGHTRRTLLNPQDKQSDREYDGKCLLHACSTLTM